MSLLVIILSLIKTFLYYSNFNIPIKYFLGLTELGLLIADDLLIIVPALLIVYILTFKLETKKDDINSTKNQSNIEKEIPIKKDVSKFRQHTSRVFKYFSFGLFALIFGFMVIGPFYLFFSANTFSEKMQAVSFIIVIGFFVLFFFKFEQIANLISIEGMAVSVLVITFVLFFVLRLKSQIDEVENGYYTGTKIITSDSTYVSDSNSYYIGQTSKYAFIYSKKDSFSTILPIEKIDKIILKTNVVNITRRNKPK
ncbi:MAG: hypothetical protein WBA96_06645 [Chitinophagaceae bacterium]